MQTETIILLAISCLTLVVSLSALAVCVKASKNKSNNSEFKKEIIDELRTTRTELTSNIQLSFKNSFDLLTELQRSLGQKQDVRIAELSNSLNESQRALRQTLFDTLKTMSETLNTFSQNNEKKLESIRVSMSDSISKMTAENEKKLEEIRVTVDEKLQKSLEDRLQRSFAAVSEQLERVYAGLGEMKSVASDVGDLKKVLSNVKTKGILGEYQLGAILEQILSPEQYDVNVITVKGSNDRVEYAIKLPGDGDDAFVYLPIDAKFPSEVYQRLVDAKESGNTAEIEEAGKALEKRVKADANYIKQKYVMPPYTTDFAILFLPFEGLYAEVVQRGLVEVLQRESKIMIAGPTTMAALLNSLQMGFRTLAIKKHTSEVWNALSAVKSEFEKFGSVLRKTQERLDQARSELENLVGTRTRTIQLRLNAMTKLGNSDEELDFERTVALIEGDSDNNL